MLDVTTQGSVATRLRYGGIFDDSFIANFPQSEPAKKNIKSVNIRQRYGLKSVARFYGSRCMGCSV